MLPLLSLERGYHSSCHRVQWFVSEIDRQIHGLAFFAQWVYAFTSCGTQGLGLSTLTWAFGTSIYIYISKKFRGSTQCGQFGCSVCFKMFQVSTEAFCSHGQVIFDKLYQSSSLPAQCPALALKSFPVQCSFHIEHTCRLCHNRLLQGPVGDSVLDAEKNLAVTQVLKLKLEFL